MRDSSICGSKIFPFLWILLLTFPVTFTKAVFRPLATIKVAMTISVFRQIVAPGLAFSGMPGTLFSIPSPLVGKPIPTCITLSVYVVATSYIRSHGVPCSQYIDDRHFGQLQIRRNAPPCLWSDFQRAQAACYILIDLRYFIGLEKSSLVPTQKPIFFWGMS